jgi:hypothetical protein
MNNLLCRDATLADLEYIAANLREADAREIQAGTALPPLQALLLGFENDTATKAIEVNGEVVCVVGYTDKTFPKEKVRYPWMMATDALDKHRLTLVRTFKKTIKEWKADGWVITNKVYSKNTAHVDLLKSCGAFTYPLQRGFLFFSI